MLQEFWRAAPMGLRGALIAAAMVLLPSAAAHARYASLVLDYQTGRVIEAEGADDLNHPASLTKMMTLYMAFEALAAKRVTLDQRLTVSAHAAGMSPSKLGLAPGDEIRLEDAILAMVTRSANDAAVTLAEGLGGSEAEFCRRMTERARRLGMRNSTFVNASGLPDPRQISTARDMATLGRALIRDFPQYYPYFDTRSFTYNGEEIGNHNHLLETYPGTDGIKTGFVNASGFNLVASTVRGGRRLIGVVFGGKTARWRDQRMVTLLDFGFGTRRGSEGVAVAANRHGPRRQQVQVADQGDAAADEPATNEPRVIAVSTRAPRSQAGGWIVQVGAFTRGAGAAAAARKATHAAGKWFLQGRPVVHRAASGTRAFRAEITGLSHVQAVRGCQLLRHHGEVCRVIPATQA